MKLVAMHISPGARGRHHVIATVRSGDRLTVYAVDGEHQKLVFAKNIDSLDEIALASVHAAYGDAGVPPVDEIPRPKPPIPHGIPGPILEIVTQFFGLWQKTSKALADVRVDRDVLG